MNNKIIISGDRQKTHAMNLIAELPLDPMHEVVIREHKGSRSAKQNRLNWLWCTELGNHLGMGKDEIHLLMKEKFAVPIFTRDSQSYAEMVEAVKEVRRKGLKSTADSLKREIVRLTTTTELNVAQMREYLSCMERFAAEVGANITFPEDLYLDSVGKA